MGWSDVRGFVRASYSRRFILQSVVVLVLLTLPLLAWATLLHVREGSVLDEVVLDEVPDGLELEGGQDAIRGHFLANMAVWEMVRICDEVGEEQRDELVQSLRALQRSFGAEGEVVREPLEALMAQDSVPRFAQLAQGVAWEAVGKLQQAETFFAAELATFPEAVEAAKKLVEVRLELGRVAEAEEMMRRFPEVVSAEQRALLHVERKEFWRAAWFQVVQFWELAGMGLLCLALVPLVVWLLFLWRIGASLEGGAGLVVLMLGAVALGALSVVPTLWASNWLHAWGKDMAQVPTSETLVSDLLYCVVGIGLKEELMKLLLFVPLLPLVLRKYDPLRAFVVASCVGLGFAVEENIGYYVQTSGSSVVRLLTANFLHLALTGLAGLALCRLVRNWRRNLDHFFQVFLLVVLAHGVYDALLMTSLAAKWSYFYGTALILIGYFYFSEVNRLYQPRHLVSLTYILVVGLAVVTLATLVHDTRITGHAFASALGLMEGLLGVAVFLFMYFRYMPEAIET